MPVNTFPQSLNEHWVIARNYAEFVKIITEKGLPEFVSFDHDLEPDEIVGDVMDIKNCKVIIAKSGMDCTKWLVEYCIDNKQLLPKYFVHSANPVGRDNINGYLESFTKTQ